MGIGIPISVDAREVKAAKREIEFLNKALNETESFGDLTIGETGLPDSIARVKEIESAVKRLRNIMAGGDRNGGLIRKDQLQDALKTTKQMSDGVQKYAKDLHDAKKALHDLIEENRRLSALGSRMTPEDRRRKQQVMTEMGEAAARKNDLEKHQRRVREAARQGTEAGDTIRGFGTMGSGQGMAMLRKTLAYGAAIYGGVSLLGLLRESWEKYKSQASAESGLAVRGFQYERRLSDWNYTPQEEAEAARDLLRATGARDMKTLDRLERFARLSDIDMGTATGFIGGYYNTTGVDPQKQRQALDALLFMGKQAKDGRSEQLLGLINQNLLIASRAQGGQALTTAQASTIMAQTAALYNAPGTMGFSSNMFQTMQNALMPGGDPTSELLKWDIVGGFKGPLTPEKMVDIQTRRNRGLNDPENLRRALAGARRFSKTRAGQIMYMQMVLNSFGAQGGVDTAAAIIDNGDRILGAKAPGSGAIGSEIDRYTGIYMGSEGYAVGQRAASRELIKLEAGGGAENILGPIEKFVLTGGDKAIKALGLGSSVSTKAANYDDIIVKTANSVGISPAWLKGMMAAESGFNPYAVSPKGAKGLLQLMPATGARYGLKTGMDFYNPLKNIPAGASYMADLLRKYNGDMYKASVAYNAGSYERGKELYDLYVSSGGKKGSKEAIEHGRKVMSAMGTYQTGLVEQERYSAHLQNMRESVDKNGAWGEKLASRAVGKIIELLTEISQKTGNNVAVGASGSLGAPLPVGDR